MSDKRLIDAEELKATLKQWFPPFTLEGLEAKTLFKQIIHDIDNAPAVEPSQNAEHDATQYSTGYQDGFLEAKKLFEPERPQGEWARHDEWRGGEYIGGFYHVNCPVEDGIFVKWPMKYCGNCGAPMKGGQADE